MSDIKVYVLKSANVHLGGKIYYKRDTPTFSSVHFPAPTLKATAERGFIVLDKKLSKDATKLAKEKANVLAEKQAEKKAPVVKTPVKPVECEFPQICQEEKS